MEGPQAGQCVRFCTQQHTPPSTSPDKTEDSPRLGVHTAGPRCKQARPPPAQLPNKEMPGEEKSESTSRSYHTLNGRPLGCTPLPTSPANSQPPVANVSLLQWQGVGAQTCIRRRPRFVQGEAQHTIKGHPFCPSREELFESAERAKHSLDKNIAFQRA